MLIDNMKSIKLRKRTVKFRLKLLDNTEIVKILPYKFAINPIFKIDDKIYKISDHHTSEINQEGICEFVSANELYIQVIL